MPVTSGASRNIVKLVPKLKLNINVRRLKTPKKSFGGRGSGGTIVIRTKSSITEKVFSRSVAFDWRMRILGFISSLEVVPFKNQLLSLTVLASGGLCYFPMVFSDQLFKFRFFTPKSKKLRLLVDNPTFSLFRRCSLHIKVSNIELIPGKGAQYARSAGCSAKIIKLDPDRHLATVQLPSGVRKVCSIHSTLSLGPSGLKERRLVRNTKAGFYKKYGKKSITRGVARNPVDHPHGGRTKSIKYPRTPWGKTTKFK